jgi:hypothetical protein
MHRIIEICFILAGVFAINFLVENVLDPNYTVGWQSRAEWKAAGSEGGMPRDSEVYERDIMRKRQSDRFGLLAAYAFLIGGYYCAKSARREIKRRGVIIPADGAERLDAATVSSNRRIVLMRFLSILLCMVFVILAISMTAEHPMQNVNEAGDIVNTNPYFGGNDDITKWLFMSYMPAAFFLAPYFVFRRITNIFGLKECLLLFAVIMAITCIFWLLVKFQILPKPRYFRQYSPLLVNIVASMGIFKNFFKKVNVAAKTLGL